MRWRIRVSVTQERNNKDESLKCSLPFSTPGLRLPYGDNMLQRATKCAAPTVKLLLCPLLIGGILTSTADAQDGSEVLFFDDFSGPVLSEKWLDNLPNMDLGGPFLGSTHTA